VVASELRQKEGWIRGIGARFIEIDDAVESLSFTMPTYC
jgi:hypothetical protein